MKTILVINDHSPEAEHAARLALQIARRIEADLLLANCQVYGGILIERTIAGALYKDTAYDRYENDLQDELECLNDSQDGFKPKISLMDMSGAGEAAFAGLAARNQVEMIICGIRSGTGETQKKLSNASLLRKINCPILLVPYEWELKAMERICYIADLRYCRLNVVRYLARFAAPWAADVSIAHLCSRRLPEMEPAYAQMVFEEQYRGKVSCPRLFFTPGKEDDIRRAVDVFIHGMNADMLVLVNQCSHFEEVLGGTGINKLPPHLTVPVLVFP